MFLHDRPDEIGGGHDLETFRTPSEFWPRRGIPPANQVDPKRIFCFWRQPVSRQRQPLLFGYGTHLFKRFGNPQRDDRIFDQCIGADDVNWLAAFLHGDFLKRVPDKLQRGRGVFAAAVADHPRNPVGRVQIGNLLHRGGGRFLEAVLGENRGGFVVSVASNHCPLRLNASSRSRSAGDKSNPR